MTETILSEEERLHSEITREDVLSKYSSRIKIVNHPYVQQQLGILRNKLTDNTTFRRTIYRLARGLAYEFLVTMTTETLEIETPLTKTKAVRIVDSENILLVTVLRAAIPFVEGLYKYFPQARTGVISAWRGPAPDFPIEVKYDRTLPINPEDIVIIADPMLATGNTSVAVGKKVLEKGKPKRLVFMSVVSAPFGVKLVLDEFPESEIWTAALDPYLNKNGYIVPGLGDAGDRCFGSSHVHELK